MSDLVGNPEDLFFFCHGSNISSDYIRACTMRISEGGKQQLQAPSEQLFPMKVAIHPN